jgi:hypothetical protein
MKEPPARGYGVTSPGIGVGPNATAGAVDTLIVDRLANERASLDDAGGLLLEDGGVNVVDVMAARVLRSGGWVLALDADELPGATTNPVLRWTM